MRLNNIIAWIVALMGTGVTAFLVTGSLKNFGITNDLPEYYAAAQMLVQNKAAQIYDLPKFFAVEQQYFPMLARGVGLFVPPMAVLLLVPLALIPSMVAPQIWTAFLCLCLVAAVVLAGRYFGLERNALAWLIGLAMLSGPASEAVRIGQVAPILMLALVAFMFAARKEKWVAAGLALVLFVLKPQQMFPLVLFLIGASRHKVLAYAGLVVVALTLVSLLFFGMDGYQSYLLAVTDKANLNYMRPEINPTIRGQIIRIVGFDSKLPTYCGIAGLLLSSIFAVALGRRSKDKSNWLEAGLLGAMPVGLLTSMHCHDYDLLLLVPGLLVMRAIKSPYVILAGLAMITFLQPFYSDIHYTYLKGPNAINPHFIALAVIAAVGAILAWKLAPAPPPPDPHTEVSSPDSSTMTE